jgi:hypothetical protein
MKKSIRKKVFLAALPVVSLGLTAQATLPAVAILGAPGASSWNNDVQSQIAATGDFSTVDVFDVATTTPSLSTLEQYAAVLVYSDAGFLDYTTLGNELAQYSEAGGGVVEAAFANATVRLGGAWATGGFEGISSAGQSSNTELTLGDVFDAASPLLNGVTSFNGGTSSFYSTGSVINGGVVVADWSNGAPLIVTTAVDGHQIVNLNFYPVSSNARSDFWVSSTDGGIIMANALLYSGGLPVPEPTTLALAGLGGAAFLLRKRK